MSVRVSVVVPTFRRPKLLARCLAALLVQDFDPLSYEIIVVEDGAGQGTSEVIGVCAGFLEGRMRENHRRPRLGRHVPIIVPDLVDTSGGEHLVNAGSPDGPDQLPAAAPLQLPTAEPTDQPFDTRRTGPTPMGAPCLRYVPLPNRRGPAAARNVGWRNAAGEIVAFTDDDCIPTPGWLRAGVAAFRPGVIGVSGRLVMPLSNAPTDYELNASHLTRSEFITANCFYRRIDLERIGGFDERFAEAWREDSDLIFTLMEHVQGGVQFVHTPEAVVIHPVRPAPWGISLLQQRKNMYNALLYKKHPSLYRQRLGQVTPWRYYVILIALLVCIAGLVTKQPVQALGAAMIWVALTGLFCLQRLERTSRAPQHVAEMAITSILIPPVALYWRAKGALRYRVWFL